MEIDTAAAFLSYCRDDGAFALRLAEDLKAGGVNVWLDQVDIKPGQEWNKAIEHALKQATRMLVVLSPASVKSENVQDEIIFARNMKKLIIPVVYKDCDVPMQLFRIQKVDLSKGYKSGIKSLIKRILEALQPPEGSAPTSFGLGTEGQGNMTESEHHELDRPVGGEEEAMSYGTSSRMRSGDQFASLGDVLRTRAQLPSLEEQLADAQSIDMSGMSLLTIAVRYRLMLLEKVKQGCGLRLLLLNPGNVNLMQMVAPFNRSSSETDHTDAIRQSLAMLQSEPALCNSIRLYDFPLAHGMLIINRDSPNARLRVEMYMCSRVPFVSPSFYIEKRNDPDWFSTFADEFEQHWKQAGSREDAPSKDLLSPPSQENRS